LGKHTVKTGFYVENNVKIQPAGGGYAGSYNFGPDSNNGVNNTGNGYANGYWDTSPATASRRPALYSTSSIGMPRSTFRITSG
jgi:hypothetical protein